jgi:uncharacterized membrane protein YbhN (UPF0104 family)
MNISAVIKRPRLKAFTYNALRLLIAAAVVIYLLTSLNLSSLYYTLLKSNVYLVIASLFLLPINIFLQFYKWKLSCRYYLSEDNKLRILNSLFAGFSAAIFTPARIGEYIGRGIEFRDKKLIDITSAVFVDKLFTLLFVVLFGAAGTLIIFNISLLYAALFLSAAALVFIILKKWNLKLKLPKIKFPDKSLSMQMSQLSLLFYLCYIIQFVLLLSAFTLKYDFILLFSAASLIMFIKTIIPNFISGELGIRESAAVFILSYLGQDPAAGFNASIFLFMINLVIPSLIGLIPLLRNKE